MLEFLYQTKTHYFVTSQLKQHLKQMSAKYCVVLHIICKCENNNRTINCYNKHVHSVIINMSILL